MRKVIYIMSEFFAPFQNVGSIKFSKIAKYLSMNKENQIVVFSRKNYKKDDFFLQNDLNEMEANGVKIFYIPEGCFNRFNGRPNRVKNKVMWLSQKIVGAEKYYYDTNQITSKKFVKKGLKILKEQNLPVPDLIISTYDDWGGHYLANELKKKFPSCLWIADFRDPIGASIKEGKYRRLCDEYSLMVSRNADFVTAVSQGCMDSLALSDGIKSAVVTNGYDFADYESVIAVKTTENNTVRKLKFAYTGSFYGNSLMPFFNAIKELLTEGLINKENLEIDYAGTYNHAVFNEIQKCGLEDIYVNKNELSRFDAVKLQDDVDVLLTAVWNRKDSQGVIGGKVLTYLMLQKPIIGIVIGELPDSELKKIMSEINCGWCYEEANHNADFEMLKNVILELYNKKINGNKIEIEYNNDYLQKFNLKNIASQYEKIYESLKKL